MTSLAIILEFTRTHEPQDPYAFRFLPQDYTRRTTGGGVERIRIEWNDEFLADLTALRDPRHDPALVRKIGEQLRQALNAAAWSSIEKQISQADRDDQSIFVTIRSNAAELYALPWELTTIGDTGAHLGELRRTVLRYEWPETTTIQSSPSPRPAGGRMLLAWSAAEGAAVPAEKHLNAIACAYRDGNVAFDPDRDVLPHASPQAIDRALALAVADGEPYAILHILAHGCPLGSTYGLMLDGHGSAEPVDAGRLCRLLSPYASTLRLVTLAACDSGNTGKHGNHLGSLAQALHRRGLQSVVASRFPLTNEGSVTLTTALYRSLLVESHSLEMAFVNARDQLVKEAGLDWASIQMYARQTDGDNTHPIVFRPYRGLEVFGTEHRRLFFGREAEIDEAVQKIRALRGTNTSTRMFFISGASGSGKSSLVFAGLLPPLTSEFAAVHAMRPGDSFDDTATARPLLCVVDQAEELFDNGAPGPSKELFAWLQALATDATGSVVIFTLRADFIGYLGAFKLPDGSCVDRLEANSGHRLFLTVMDPPSMADAILGPAKRVGLGLERGLVGKLVDEISGEPGGLPLLEFALDRMWTRRHPTRGLTHDIYDDLGGSIGALLEREADSVINAMSSQDQTEARRLLVQLVAVGDGARPDTRRRRTLQELSRMSDEALGRVIVALTEARLVVMTGDAGMPQIELAHEELIRRWSRLRRWLTADREKWSEIETVRSWAHMLRGAELARAQEARARYGGDLGKQALEHIKQSEQAVIDEALRDRRLRTQRSVAFIAAIVIGTVAFMLYYRGKDADRLATKKAELAAQAHTQQRRAERSARDLNGLLAATTHYNSPQLQLGLLRELESPEIPATSPVWNKHVIDALRSPWEQARLELDQMVVAVAFSPDNRKIAAASGSAARIWDVGNPTAEPVQFHHDARVRSVAFSPDSRTLISGDDSGQVRVWSVDSPGAPRAEFSHDWYVRALAFDKSGKRLATGSLGTVEIRDASDPTRVLTTIQTTYSIHDVAFSPDGEHIATVGLHSEAQLWKLSQNAASLDAAYSHGDFVNAVGFSPDGTSVLTASADGLATVWRTDDSTTPRALLRHDASVNAAAFDQSGQWVITGADDGKLRFWNLRHPTEPVTVTSFDFPILDVAYSGDFRMVATASEDRTARILSVEQEPTLRMKAAFPIRAAALGPGGIHLATASERVVQIWRTDDIRTPAREIMHHDLVNSVEFSPDERVLVTACSDGYAYIWAVEGEGEPLARLLHGQPVHSASYSPDGLRVLTASDFRNADTPGMTAEWDPGSPGKPLWLRLYSGRASHARYFRQRDGFVTVANNAAFIWSGNGKDRVHKRIDTRHSISALALSDNPPQIAIASDGTVKIQSIDASWAAPFDFSVVTYSGHRDMWERAAHKLTITDMDFLLDGSRLAVAYTDATVRIIDPDEDDPLLLTLEHDGAVNSVRYSADGTRLITASEDSYARIWTAWGGPSATALERIWETLWRASDVCPSTKARQTLLGRTQEQAARDSERCNDMIRCVEKVDRAKFGMCHREFRRSQFEHEPFGILER